MKYKSIAFIDDNDDADYLIGEIEEGDTQTALDELKQWETGEEEIEDTPPWGTKDKLVRIDGYVISYNAGLPYIALTKVVTHEQDETCHF